MTTADDSRSVIRRHSRSFSLAARLLAPAPRRRAENLYAWCRAADDAVDKAPTPRDASAALEQLHDGLAAVYRGGHPPDDPTAEALRSVVGECAIPRRYPEDMLAGMAMDVAGTRYETADDLLLYCYRVAGVVGLMMCHALGVCDDRALPHAAHLGIAMQLTNIARDVAEDWSKDRLYLPTDWLGRIPAAGEPLDDASLAPAIRRLLSLADQYYASGDAGLRYLDRRSRFGIRVARSVYAAIGHQVVRAGCRATAGRAVVPGWKKCWLVLTSLAAECAEKRSEYPPPTGSPLGIMEFHAIG